MFAKVESEFGVQKWARSYIPSNRFDIQIVADHNYLQDEQIMTAFKIVMGQQYQIDLFKIKKV